MNWRKYVRWGLTGLVIAAQLYAWVWLFGEHNDRLEREKAEMRSADAKLTAAVYRGDSATSALAHYSGHRVLVDRMRARDDGSDTLLTWIGSPAILKWDSSSCVVSDVVSGGGRFDYYVRCVVVRRDGSTLSVSPDMLSR